MGKFTGINQEIKIPQCYECRHYTRDYTCTAYRQTIPDDILDNIHDHCKPFPGDNGIQFEPIKAAPNDQ